MNLQRFLTCVVWLSVLSGCGDEPSAPAPSFTALDSRVASAMESLHLPGVAVCVARGERVIFCRRYGQADLETGRPMTEHTPLLLASITKTVTAVTIMSMVERGLLDLDRPIVGSLDFKLGHPHADAVTLRHLLTHSGGIADSAALGVTFYSIGRDSSIPLADAVRGYFEPGGTYYNADANFLPQAPGTTWSYANQGYSLVGRIGELAAGEDFREACRHAVLEPLRMDHSSLRLDDFSPNEVAVPYHWNGTRHDTYGPYTFADYPNGGLFASAYDIVRFAAAVGTPALLEARGVLGRASREEMLRPYIPAPEVDGTQAIGFIHTEFAGESMYGHDGSEWGVTTFMRIRARDGMAAVVLTNNGVKQGIEPALAILESLFEVGTSLEHAPSRKD
ncbi:beta-lactamase family protein [Myxococcaceae bacterium JPH2]|nr:beta-lactamase family protein [Myxococcaceae bacterium JPH2]